MSLLAPAPFTQARACGHLFDVGSEHNVTPYGTEALSVMRIEKGHIAGPELSGQTTASDLGLQRMLSSKKDFIGRALSNRPHLVDPDRPALVGLLPTDPARTFTAGGHLVPKGYPADATNACGYVTSVAYSPMLDSGIALALFTRGRERHGDIVMVHDLLRGTSVEAKVCDPVFFDHEGVRVRG